MPTKPREVANHDVVYVAYIGSIAMDRTAPAKGGARLHRMTPVKFAISTLIALIAVKLTHLQALVIFALVISISFGFLGRRQPKERIKYILWTLLLFLLVGVGIGWAMYPFSR